MTQQLQAHKEELAKADQSLRSMAGKVTYFNDIINGNCNISLY